MIRSPRLLMALTLLVSLWRPAHAELPVLRIGYYDFPPSIYTDAAGATHGPTAEVMRKVAHQAGYEPYFRALPSARLYAALRDGSVDVWPGATGKPELAPHTLEGRNLLGEVDINLYLRPGSALPHSLDALPGEGLIVLNGYNYAPQVLERLRRPGMRLHKASSHVAALEMLLHGRGDYLLDYGMPASQARRALGVPELPSLPVRTLPIRFIASRYAPDAAALLERLDQAYDALDAAGVDLRVPSR
ncbi:substrate-binding periplasmic protein [Stutzerimonas urumqiensis]|uniref:substrate-binding periplasmic protein n=1 Tax=Stutzerimonas urumqiensis TaxID=638269 RepID=UPI0015ADB3E3|nr:transporter substrate-binding domain-containing protein [Stutzerimonas urumqiensis]